MNEDWGLSICVALALVVVVFVGCKIVESSRPKKSTRFVFNGFMILTHLVALGTSTRRAPEPKRRTTEQLNGRVSCAIQPYAVCAVVAKVPWMYERLKF